MLTDEQYEAVCAKIAEYQNENYASPDAADLQSLLGDVVLQEYYDSLSFVDGEVDTFWLDE